jgi:succinate dehydrogenase / fumarate reductase membrane anchor subunit
MTLRSPLSRVLGKGSAKEGTDHWWAQRVSAVALLLLGMWFAVSLCLLQSFAAGSVLAWAARPFNSVMLLALSVTLAWHSSLGIQVVIEDYVHGPLLKVASLVASRLAHVFLAIAAAFAIVRMATGGAL